MKQQIKHLPAEERRAVTVDAVIQLAAEQNPSGITTSAIAKHMGLSQGAIFKHFPTKEAIIEAVMERITELLLARVDKAVKAVPSPLAALEAMFMAHVEFVVKHPGVPRILFGELQRAEDSIAKRIVQTLTLRYGDRLQKIFAEGKAVKELDADLDTEASAILFVGMIQGLVVQSLLAGDVSRMRHEAPRVFTIYRRGIKRKQ